MRPELIDVIAMTQCLADKNRWVILKPFRPTGLFGLQVRIHHAWLVLTGKATAVIFDEDI